MASQFLFSSHKTIGYRQWRTNRFSVKGMCSYTRSTGGIGSTSLEKIMSNIWNNTVMLLSLLIRTHGIFIFLILNRLAKKRRKKENAIYPIKQYQTGEIDQMGETWERVKGTAFISCAIQQRHETRGRRLIRRDEEALRLVFGSRTTQSDESLPSSMVKRYWSRL